MKFSVFYEMQISKPTRPSEAQLFRDCLEQAVLADELGYHCVWEVEHHGLYEYSHSSAPEIFLSFVAARTKRIRLGHGVTLLPFRYNHPIRIAERIQEKGFTVVPLQLYFKDQYIKVEIGVAKGKKLHDKRESAKAKEDNRAIARAMRAKR